VHIDRRDLGRSLRPDQVHVVSASALQLPTNIVRAGEGLPRDNATSSPSWLVAPARKMVLADINADCRGDYCCLVGPLRVAGSLSFR
jgi:hypothetical protein